MVGEQVIQCTAALAHGNALSTGVVILLHRCGRAAPFQVVAHIGCGGAAHHRLYPVAVAVVRVSCLDVAAALDLHQAILGVVDQRVGDPAHQAN